MDCIKKGLSERKKKRKVMGMIKINLLKPRNLHDAYYDGLVSRLAQVNDLYMNQSLLVAVYSAHKTDTNPERRDYFVRALYHGRAPNPRTA